VNTEEAYNAAKIVGLNLCRFALDVTSHITQCLVIRRTSLYSDLLVGATLKHNLGDLDKVKRIVKLTGFVNCIDGFSSQVRMLVLRIVLALVCIKVLLHYQH
jgi:hypothetical protein